MTPPESVRADEIRHINRVTLIGAAVDALLGIGKIVIGSFANSHALVADGVHSLTDLVTDAGVLVVARSSRADPDEDHPYGHARFETLASLALGAILLLIAGALAQDSLLRLLAGDTVIPGAAALVAAAVSVIAKEWIFRLTRRVADEIGSRLLLANAWHSRSDALSSIAVLVGVAGAMAGWAWCDLIAAVVVAAMIGWVGWTLIAAAARELVDTSIPEEELALVRSATLDVPGVLGVHQLRSRRMGAQVLLDLDVEVGPTLSVSEGHGIATAVSEKLVDGFPDITDVTVHVDPVRARRPSGRGGRAVYPGSAAASAGAGEQAGEQKGVDQSTAAAATPATTQAVVTQPLKADAEQSLRRILEPLLPIAIARMTLHYDVAGVDVELFLEFSDAVDRHLIDSGPSDGTLRDRLRDAGFDWVASLRTWVGRETGGPPSQNPGA